MGTRGLVNIRDLRAKSTWQDGPKFLQQKFVDWPQGDDNTVQDQAVPPEECYNSGAVVLHSVEDSMKQANPVETILEHAGKQSKLGASIKKLCTIARKAGSVGLHPCQEFCQRHSWDAVNRAIKPPQSRWWKSPSRCCSRTRPYPPSRLWKPAR